MTDNLKHIWSEMKGLSVEERKFMIAELVRHFGVEFGVWDIQLKEKNTVLFINNRGNSHGFTFSKEGEFKIL